MITMNALMGATIALMLPVIPFGPFGVTTVGAGIGAGSMIALLLPVIPCGPFGVTAVGAVLGGLAGAAMALPLVPLAIASALCVAGPLALMVGPLLVGGALLCAPLALPCLPCLMIPCGEATEGMFMGLGDAIGGFCGTLAI